MNGFEVREYFRGAHMISTDSLNCIKLRASFEGQEAIYEEKGYLRVRVSNIRYELSERRIDADVEEIPTVGLDGGRLRACMPKREGPLRWQIGAGFLTTFSDSSWQAGYGGWCLWFAPEIVDGIVRLASSWPADLDERERNFQVFELLCKHPPGPSTRVFSERDAPPYS